MKFHKLCSLINGQTYSSFMLNSMIVIKISAVQAEIDKNKEKSCRKPQIPFFSQFF